MNRIGTGLLLTGLLAFVGCTSDSMEKIPEPPKKTAHVKENKLAEDEVPAAVSKLLPPEQITARNAEAQYQIMFETLKKEKGQLNRTESALRDE